VFSRDKVRTRERLRSSEHVIENRFFEQRRVKRGEPYDNYRIDATVECHRAP
jgi:hypothetical protein